MSKPVPRGTADSVGVSKPEGPSADSSTEMEPLWSTKDYARFRRIADQTARVERMNHEGPPYYRIRGRAYYNPADVRRWLAGRRYQNTAEETVARERDAAQRAGRTTRTTTKARAGRGVS